MQLRVTFIDTPGHEAFLTMRANASMVADAIVLVIAADEGIRPQTLEVIARANEEELPVLILINKIDLVTKRQIMHLRSDLKRHMYFCNYVFGQ